MGRTARGGATMAVKTSSGGQRARANPTEALIPDNLLHYTDRYDRRWRGEKPYIGLGNAVRNKIKEDLSTSVRWLLPGDLIDWCGFCDGLMLVFLVTIPKWMMA
jgi:hypothetical protein